MARGTLRFDVTQDGDLVDSAANVESLRRLWLDRSMINGDDLGEGDPGDFDHGAWHLACHLAAAGGVRRSKDARLLWLEISHNAVGDDYYASVTARADEATRTWPLNSAEGRALLRGSTLLGFVEGNSVGRTSARGVNDPPTLFNLWRRQDFDQPIDGPEDGGKVWEHWSTTRDIRQSCRIGTSVLSAYVSLVAAIGGLFPAMVARGRQDYAHPKQLGAMIHAGFVGEPSALSEITPVSVPPAAERLLLEAEPSLALQAIESLDWDGPPRYYMFARRIDRWCPASLIKEQLGKFGSSQ